MSEGNHIRAAYLWHILFSGRGKTQEKTAFALDGLSGLLCRWGFDTACPGVSKLHWNKVILTHVHRSVLIGDENAQADARVGRVHIVVAEDSRFL